LGFGFHRSGAKNAERDEKQNDEPRGHFDFQANDMVCFKERADHGGKDVSQLRRQLLII
jgi:hypothetical protein